MPDIFCGKAVGHSPTYETRSTGLTEAGLTTSRPRRYFPNGSFPPPRGLGGPYPPGLSYTRT